MHRSRAWSRGHPAVATSRCRRRRRGRARGGGLRASALAFALLASALLLDCHLAASTARVAAAADARVMRGDDARAPASPRGRGDARSAKGRACGDVHQRGIGAVSRLAAARCGGSRTRRASIDAERPRHARRPAASRRDSRGARAAAAPPDAAADLHRMDARPARSGDREPRRASLMAPVARARDAVRVAAAARWTRARARVQPRRDASSTSRSDEAGGSADANRRERARQHNSSPRRRGASTCGASQRDAGRGSTNWRTGEVSVRRRRARATATSSSPRSTHSQRRAAAAPADARGATRSAATDRRRERSALDLAERLGHRQVRCCARTACRPRTARIERVRE